MLKSIVFIQTWWVLLLGLLFLKKFLSERIMNAAQAHNIQVWKEFSNIKDTYLKRLFKNIHKHQRIRKTWPLTSKPKALRNVSKYFYLLCNMKRKSISFHQPVSTWWRWSLATVIPSGNVPSVWAACMSWPCQREVFPQKARWINTHESWSKQGCRIVFVVKQKRFYIVRQFINCLTMICHFPMANLKCGCWGLFFHQSRMENRYPYSKLGSWAGQSLFSSVFLLWAAVKEPQNQNILIVIG